jgi:benzoyl-CoA-dihydrodiol lyase
VSQVQEPVVESRFVNYETSPAQYRHWRVNCDGAIATLSLDVQEDATIQPGYKLKLNSYDLGVDIELHDALQRIRFEHPEVRAVIVTSSKPRVFCSGANIYMLGLSSHTWKVNFCKFTNETRNSMEDSSRSGLKFIAACNGSTAGGGYELALACDEIILVDDRSSAVSLPEIPLLGVLPGTGGLTRLTDKRKVRRDRADVFCTSSEGLQGQRAKDWGFVDEIVKPQQFAEFVRKRADTLATENVRPAVNGRVLLTPLNRTIDADGYHYEYVDVEFDRKQSTATITVRCPGGFPTALDDIIAAGASWWPLQMARELDDAILSLRTNELELGLWILRTTGDLEKVLAIDRQMMEHRGHWLVSEVLGMLRRTLARLDVSARSMYAVIEPGSCFSGTLLELALAADRVYMLDPTEGDGPRIAISELNFGAFPTVGRVSRIEARFYGDATTVDGIRSRIGSPLSPKAALDLGLITFAPDDLDWADELRQAVESRTALSPDALSGMEANLRFGLPETMETRVFGRLSAWQNWIFIRPNAVGPTGALKVYGTGTRAKFGKERV